MGATGNKLKTVDEESGEALKSVFAALDERRSFKLEAGAGAGKTTSLIEALQRILANRRKYLPRKDQRVACVTYTNVARNEIIRRTDSSPYVYAETIHGFLWNVIAPFEKQLAREVLELDSWQKYLDGRTSLDGFSVHYRTGFPKITDDCVELSHNDVPVLAAKLFSLPKFRAIVSDRFPIIFVDEYQDTPKGLAEAMLGDPGTSLRGSTFGFFGDHWQQIYQGTCGPIDQPSVEPIAKRANFRSCAAVVDLLNKMRPELLQAKKPDAGRGSVAIYHTNNWSGVRQKGHKKGQISSAAAKSALEWVTNDAQQRHWVGPAPDVKVLMLTHAAIADEVGFGGISSAFQNNEAYAKKEDYIIAFLMDVLEPAFESFQGKRYGAMFEVLSHGRRPVLQSGKDKIAWAKFFNSLAQARSDGSIGDVLDLCLKQRLFGGIEKVMERQDDLEAALRDLQPGEELKKEQRRLAEYAKLRNVKYIEAMALRRHLDEKTPFSTQHGVKGAQYDSVVAVIGGGHPQHKYAEMLESFPRRAELSGKDLERFTRARNLFYVACSRAERHLVLLCTTDLSSEALQTLQDWVGPSGVTAVRYEGDEAVGGEQG
ncbi:AAA family ATPase [Streptomyces sp. NBC_00828]|uniref:UvrD-helicase domain-containing protein n=1 Tax=Streptomyces sp. NBC_00828 TaxID=2903678 RepID=UPI00386C66D5